MMNDFETRLKQFKAAYAVVAKCKKALDVLVKEGEGIPLGELPADYLAALAVMKAKLSAAEQVLLEKNNACAASQSMLLVKLGM